jgi:hypothetical protein
MLKYTASILFICLNILAHGQNFLLQETKQAIKKIKILQLIKVLVTPFFTKIFLRELTVLYPTVGQT